MVEQLNCGDRAVMAEVTYSIVCFSTFGLEQSQSKNAVHEPLRATSTI